MINLRDLSCVRLRDGNEMVVELLLLLLELEFISKVEPTRRTGHNGVAMESEAAAAAPIVVEYNALSFFLHLKIMRESVTCFNTIKRSWQKIEDVAKKDGLLHLSRKFHLCQSLTSTEDLSNWLSSAYSYLAMVNYPYPSSFMRPLPANPIKEVCRMIDSYPEGTSILQRIFAGVSIYYKYTGTVDCFDLGDDPHGMSGWDWQACTEMVMPMSSSRNNSMFPTYDFDYASYKEECIQDFGVKPRPRWITTEFGGHILWKTFGATMVFCNQTLGFPCEIVNNHVILKLKYNEKRNLSQNSSASWLHLDKKSSKRFVEMCSKIAHSLLMHMMKQQEFVVDGSRIKWSYEIF